MRISDWSSDVCSSDLDRLRVQQVRGFLSVRTEQRRSIDDRITEAGDDVRELVRQLVAEVREFVTRLARLRQAKQLLLRDLDRRVVAGLERSAEPTSELQSLMRISYAVFCLTNTTHTTNCAAYLLSLYHTNQPSYQYTVHSPHIST